MKAEQKVARFTSVRQLAATICKRKAANGKAADAFRGNCPYLNPENIYEWESSAREKACRLTAYRSAPLALSGEMIRMLTRLNLKHGRQPTVSAFINTLFMKRSILLTVILLCAGITGAMAQVCQSQVLTYNGPRNTAELTARLQAAPDAILATLSTGTIQSLTDNIIFENDLPVAIADIDGHIQEIFEASNGDAIWTAVFNCPVKTCTYDTKPTIGTITYDELRAIMDATNSYVTTKISLCSNCKKNSPPGCCEVGGTGCFDSYNEVDGQNYHTTF
jgi:hypothetical protein